MYNVILRSGWQDVNIGDIAHTPGALTLIEREMPDLNVTLWAAPDMSAEVTGLIQNRFPKVKIVSGRISDPNAIELLEAVKNADFLLHSSGACFVAYTDVKEFVEHTHKPFGIWGISFSGIIDQVELMNQAEFIFFRDSESLKVAKDVGVKCKTMDFGPDCAFSTDLRNDALAEKYLAENGLVEKQFVCCIPRLRYTPYWEIRNQAFDDFKFQRNEEMKEHDHKPLRDAIIEIVSKTDKKVLICPEDMTQIKVGKEMIFDCLPENIKEKCVLRDKFWLTDEALSIYTKSSGLFGNEMHSPIMCIGNNVPAIVCRWKEQTTKGYMWNDIGLNSWLFDFDIDSDIERLPAMVLDMVVREAESQKAVESAYGQVRLHQVQMANAMKNFLATI